MSDKANQFQSLFVVIDPTRMIQPALIKGESIAARDSASLRLYCCVFDERYVDNEKEQQVEIDLTREWLDRLAAPGRERGLKVEIHVEWDANWRDAIVAAANAAGSSLVIKTASRHSAMGRRLMKTSDWTLLNHCVRPVLLVSGHRLWVNKKVLAAVKVKPEDKLHQQLNDDLIELARNISAGAGSELFAVTAYKGEGIFFDRQQLADLCGLPRSSVFSEEGAPERAIAKVAEDIKADVVVIGNPGGSARNTARWLIDQVTSDVLVLPNRQP